MGLLDNFNSPEMAFGMGLLDAAGPSRMPVSFGQALSQGTRSMQQAQEAQQMQAYKKLQMDAYKQQQDEALRKREAIANFRGQLPPNMQQLFDVAPDQVLGQLFKKPEAPIKLGKDDRLLDPTDPSKVLVDAVPPERKTPEGMQFDATGNLVAIPGYLDMKTRIAAAGRPVNSSTVHLPPMESEENKALGKQLAEDYAGIQKAGFVAQSNISNLNRVESLLTGVTTGKLAPLTKDIASLAASVGINIDPKLPAKEAAVALANEMALKAKNSGGENLMPGAMSDPDRNFLQQMVPSLSNTPEGNKIIIETLRRKAKRDQDVAKMARAYRDKHKTLNGFTQELAAWSEQNPLFSDLMTSVPQAAPTGQFKIIGVR